MEEEILEKYHALTRALIQKNTTISTMESCTGGLLGVLLSDLEGASAVVSGGAFTYSNESKIIHGVPEEIIRDYGVYSMETAYAMAAACRREFGTDIGIGVTGSIGTVDPNNADSIPGEVYIGIDIRGRQTGDKLVLAPASRRESRWQIADRAVDLITL